MSVTIFNVYHKEDFIILFCGYQKSGFREVNNPAKYNNS